MSLVLEYRHIRTSVWSSGSWEVIGAVAGQHGLSQARSAVAIHKDEDGEQILCRGYRLTLHRDDAESYYFNLMGERPSLFVVCREDNGGRPEPALVTASYGEAASYSEVDEHVYAVPMPPEIYRWIEAYVVEHYVPEKRRKRKRDDWKQDASRR